MVFVGGLVLVAVITFFGIFIEGLILQKLRGVVGELFGFVDWVLRVFFSDVLF